MELTKQDKRRIEETTDNIIARIRVDAGEYARLYEREFKLRLIERLQNEIDAAEYVAEHIKSK